MPDVSYLAVFEPCDKESRKLPLTIIFPLLCSNLALLVFPPERYDYREIFPDTFIVCIFAVSVARPFQEYALPTLRDPQESVPSPVIDAVFGEDENLSVTPPLTASSIFSLMASVPVLPEKTKERHVASTVRVTPAGIVISSPVAGTPIGDHISGLLQLPVLAVLAAADSCVIVANVKIIDIHKVFNFGIVNLI
jgi:hypothetical protein